MVVVVLQTSVEVGRPRRDVTPITIGKTVTRILKHIVTTPRTIAVVEGCVVQVREVVPAVVVIPIRWVEGVDSPEGGVLSHHRGAEEDPVAVGGDRVLYGPPRNLDRAPECNHLL